MFNRKRIGQGLVFLVAFLAPVAIGEYANQNSTGTRADGTAPPAPPIPYATVSGQSLRADGTAPPAPPIPYPKEMGKGLVLQADGTAPPAPPIPWMDSSIAG